jgi:hypothetical protein
MTFEDKNEKEQAQKQWSGLAGAILCKYDVYLNKLMQKIHKRNILEIELENERRIQFVE